MPKHTLFTREDERGDEWDRWADKARALSVAERTTVSVSELIRRAVEVYPCNPSLSIPSHSAPPSLRLSSSDTSSESGAGDEQGTREGQSTDAADGLLPVGSQGGRGKGRVAQPLAAQGAEALEHGGETASGGFRQPVTDEEIEAIHTSIEDGGAFIPRPPYPTLRPDARQPFTKERQTKRGKE